MHSGKPRFIPITEPQLAAGLNTQILVIMLVKGYPAAHENASGIPRKTDQPVTEIL